MRRPIEAWGPALAHLTNTGIKMTNKAKTPKALLADQELIGFARAACSGDQIARRASSAKVTVEMTDIAKQTTPATHLERKSGW